MPTAHYNRVKEFCTRAGQEVPTSVTVPDEPTRILRAKLILEEAFETVKALGITVDNGNGPVDYHELRFAAGGAVDLEGVADGCADISVVTIGTLVAFGMDDEKLLEEVDAANLRKFGPGHSRREDGKLIKPKDWTPPNIRAAVGF